MLSSLFWSELVAIAFVVQVSSQWTVTPFNPPSVPLAVRSPYLNIWLTQNLNPPALSDFYPQSSATSFVEWYAAVKVDGQTCRIMGVGGDGISQANQTAMEFTATRTSFLSQCFDVAVNATFLTPIDATDLVRQSMPFSYFYMNAEATDGKNHNISMYSDIGANLLTGSSPQILVGNSPDLEDGRIILSMQMQTPQPFAEGGINGSFGTSLDAAAFYGIKTDDIFPSAYSWEISLDSSSRGNFVRTSALSNTSTTAIEDSTASNNSVLAISVDLGTTSSTGNIVWAIGVPRDPVIQYVDADGNTEDRRPYYMSMSSFLNASDALQFFLEDFGTEAISGAIEMDARLQNDAGNVSPEYAALVSLVARQALSAMDITIKQNSDGSWDTSDVKAFMDNTGGAGSTNGVNVVDILYASLPAYLYFNPDLAAYLLSPLLEYEDSTQYQLPYAARSIGSVYPNATADGINQPHQLGIEETANMIIITLAHAQRSGNGTLISKHYSLLRRWADYLVGNALFPVNQTSLDFNQSLNLTDLPTSNMTNTALKGIIGIAAMGKISSYAGVSSDASNLTNIAQTYIKQWATLTISSDKSHLLMTYGDDESEALMYNLYADKLLQLGLVPDEVYDVHTTYIDSQISLNLTGIPLDSNNISLGVILNTHVYALFSRTDWMMLSAAVSTKDTTRNSVIEMLFNLASSNHSSSPFCIEFEVQTGLCVGGYGSPAQAAMFALLGLEQPILSSISIPSSGSTIPSMTSHKKSHTGAIVGGIIGGLAALALIAGADRYLRRRRQRQRSQQRLRHRDYYNLEGLKGGRSPGLAHNRAQVDTKSPQLD